MDAVIDIDIDMDMDMASDVDIDKEAGRGQRIFETVSAVTTSYIITNFTYLILP